MGTLRSRHGQLLNFVALILVGRLNEKMLSEVVFFVNEESLVTNVIKCKILYTNNME